MSAREFPFDSLSGQRPPAPLPAGGARELAWQFLAIVALALGANYLRWRWMQSLNLDALWFAIPLAVAETLAFVGLALTVFQWWTTRDPLQQDPPRTPAECGGVGERALVVDVAIIAREGDDPERVRSSVLCAQGLTYPHPLDLRVHVVDREAGAPGDGDFVVLCDAGTRLFPRLLEHTLGYFRDPRVACVQTPPWFEDLPAGVPLPQWLQQRFGAFGRWLGAGLQELVGTVRIGQDPFACDPQPFFALAQRRRSRSGAVACCGSGAVLRRERGRADGNGRSVLHPHVQAASLAPPDLATALDLRWQQWIASFEAALHPKPGRDRAQRRMDFAMRWNAFACLWNLAFLIAPFVYFLTGIAPLAGYTSAFYLHAVPFLFVLQLALVVTTWGVPVGKARAFDLALAPQQVGALWHMLRGRASAPPFAREQQRRGLHLVLPQVTLAALTLAGLALAGWRVFVQGQGQELPALIVNGAWAVFNLVALLAPVRAALWRPEVAAARPVPATA